MLLQHIIRKERAVGLIPGAPTIYEVLEELAITVQQQLVDAPLPFCAFNGGGDVFVDVGNKSLGLEALMQYLKFNPSQVCSVALLKGRRHHMLIRFASPQATFLNCLHRAAVMWTKLKSPRKSVLMVYTTFAGGMLMRHTSPTSQHHVQSHS